MAITNPWDMSQDVRVFYREHAIMEQKARQEETLRWWFEIVKEWEYIYKTILNYEEVVPSCRVADPFEAMYYGSNFRIDLGLRILADLQEYSNYEIVKQPDPWSDTRYKESLQSIGQYHQLFVGSETVTFCPKTMCSTDTKRLFTSLCSFLCRGNYKSPRYRVIEFVAEQFIDNVDNAWVIGRHSFSTSQFLLDCSRGDIIVEYRQDGKHREGFIMDFNNMFDYPELDRFFGKLNGRKLTEEDIALYEMVHGHKPLFYNLEYKI